MLRQRIGFELELLAPCGSSRRDLAGALATSCGGSLRPVWHSDSEPALVASLGGRFLHLTQGFEVVRPSGELMCALVDDVTITADLDAAAPAPAGWYRMLTDDPRLLRLLAKVSDPGGSLETSLDGAASLWGVRTERFGQIFRIESDGATVALAAPSGGERERPCEIVTPPIVADHEAALSELLEVASELGFTVPAEAAVHLHFDGKRFRDAGAFANVVRLFGWWREPLRALLETNPQCKRLAQLPAPLVELVGGSPSWEELREASARGALSKFFDVNLTQLLRDDPLRDTLEVRVLPGTIDAADVLSRAALVESLLDRCCETERFPKAPAATDDAISDLRRLAEGERY
ncbi:MAG: amidoligase family protein [Acidothermaceae bacterium]